MTTRILVLDLTSRGLAARVEFNVGPNTAKVVYFWRNGPRRHSQTRRMSVAAARKEWTRLDGLTLTAVQNAAVKVTLAEAKAKAEAETETKAREAYQAYRAS